MTTDSGGICQQCGRPTEGRVCAHCAVKNALDPGEEEILTQFKDAEGADASNTNERRYGPYRAIRILGEGGFGTVYLALQSKPIRRHVALKVLKKGIGSGKHLLARFELERQALARMDHPSICRVYDAGETASGEPYFAMEVVDGRPINRYCQETRLPLPKILALFREVCSAVEHAHQRGVIHRDLKPSNILVTERDGEPHPVIIDFGIAKAMEPLLESDTILTLSFQIIGTPAYMSPEQAESGGHDADVRSDVYALGAVLYELLTGRPPISMEELRKVGLSAALRMIREADTPPPSARLTEGGDAATQGATENQSPTISAKRLRGDLDWITMRALAKDRERRYQRARDLSDDLGRFVDGMPVLAGPPGLVYRGCKFARRHPAAVAAAAAAIVLGLTVLVLREISAAADARTAKDRLVEANQSFAPFAVADVTPYLSRLRTDLQAIREDRGRPFQARINAALALASGDESEIPRVCAFLLGEEGDIPSSDQAAALQAVILRSPLSVPATVAGRAGTIARNPKEPRERRLCAVALLAAAVPAGAHWPEFTNDIARLACGSGTVGSVRWARTLQPISSRLLPPIGAIFSEEADSPSGLGAAILLSEFHAGDAETLAELATTATPTQFHPLASALLACGDDGGAAAERLLARDESLPPEATEEERDAAALRRARAGMLVFLNGGGESVWPLLHRPDWGDPRLRTFLIHSFSDYGIPPHVPASRLTAAADPSERAALLLALGGYLKGKLAPPLLASTVEAVKTLARSDPSAEVHGAAGWLLGHWHEPLPKAPADNPPPVSADSSLAPTWEDDPVLDLDFVVFRGPVKFPMGSPASEPGRFSNEMLHEASIPHSFKLAAKILTRAQVEDYLPGYFRNEPDTTSADLPARGLSLDDARKLCNFISADAGIPVEQWCYTEGDSPIPKENITLLAGYRFPTEPEWEFACRGGSSAPRPYGYAEALLPEYAGVSPGGGGGGLVPPGTKRPNGFGLYDMLGNLQNFVEGFFGPYPGDAYTKPLDPARMIGLSDDSYDLMACTLLRGQHAASPLLQFRSAWRSINVYPSQIRIVTAGLRLARTIPSPPSS